MNFKLIGFSSCTPILHLLTQRTNELDLAFSESSDTHFVGSVLSYFRLSQLFIVVRNFNSATACQAFALFNATHGTSHRSAPCINTLKLLDYFYYLMCYVNFSRGGPAIATAVLLKHDVWPGKNKKEFTKKSLSKTFLNFVSEITYKPTSFPLKGTVGFYSSNDPSKGHVIGFNHIPHLIYLNEWVFMDSEFKDSPLNLLSFSAQKQCLNTFIDDRGRTLLTVFWKITTRQLSSFLWEFSRALTLRLGDTFNSNQLFVTLLSPCPDGISSHAPTEYRALLESPTTSFLPPH